MLTNKTKVLVVDDFELIRKIITDALSEIEFSNFCEAKNGVEAKSMLLKQLKGNEPIGLVFLDWNMPNENGMDVLKFCRSHKKLKDVPIIMVTAEGEKKQVLNAFKEGANDYIVKPCSPAIIQQKVFNLQKRLQEAS